MTVTLPDPLAASDAAWRARRHNGAAHLDSANGGEDGGRDTGAEPLAPIDPTTLHGVPVPPRQWLVPDWVPMARVTAIYGAGGEGKTLLAQMLATACAIGARWLGLPVRQCRSLLIYCEDDLDEMHRRQTDINAHYGCDFSALGAMRWLPRLGSDNALMQFLDGRGIATKLLRGVLAAAAEHNAQLLVADTLTDVFSGNENDRSQARQFAQSALGWLARETGGAVMALAHPSRAGMNSGSGESGSTAWVGTVRSQLHLASPRADEGEPADPDARILTRRKSNAARRDETIELRWRDGVFVRTGPPAGILGSIERRNCEDVFLALLDRVTADGRHVSDSDRAPNFAPKLFAMRPDREGYGRPDFGRAMQSLFAERRIRLGPRKAPDRKTYTCIIRTDAPEGAGGAGGSP